MVRIGGAVAVSLALLWSSLICLWRFFWWMAVIYSFFGVKRTASSARMPSKELRMASEYR